jgi:hypothetical protein
MSGTTQTRVKKADTATDQPFAASRKLVVFQVLLRQFSDEEVNIGVIKRN